MAALNGCYFGFSRNVGIDASGEGKIEIKRAAGAEYRVTSPARLEALHRNKSRPPENKDIEELAKRLDARLNTIEAAVKQNTKSIEISKLEYAIAALKINLHTKQTQVKLPIASLAF